MKIEQLESGVRQIDLMKVTDRVIRKSMQAMIFSSSLNEFMLWHCGDVILTNGVGKLSV